MSTPTSRAAADRRRALVLAVGFVNIAASIGFTRFALTVIMPDMRRGLGLSYTELGTLATIGFALYMVVSPMAGVMGVRFGTRWTIAASLALIALGFGGLALASGFWTALAANLLVQLGGAGANAAGFTIAAGWFTSRRGAATGVVMGGAGAGVVLVGQLVPRILAATPDGWRAAWGGIAAVSALIAIVCAVLLPDSRSAPRSDVAARLGSRPALRGDVRIWVLSVLVGAFGFSHIVFGTFFAAHLTTVGWAIGRIGHMWSIVGVATIVSGLIGGALSDRIGRFRTLGVLLAGQAAASMILASAVGQAEVLASVLLYGGTLMGFPAVVGALSGDLAGPDASRIMGFVNVFFSGGQMLGPFLAGMVIDATGTVGPALTLAAAVSTVGAAAALIAARRLVAVTPAAIGG